MFVVFLKMLEMLFHLLLVKYLLSCRDSNRTFWLNTKHSLFAPQNFTQLLFYQFSWDDTNIQEKSKTRVMQNVAR